jgi:hypothetical protein
MSCLSPSTVGQVCRCVTATHCQCHSGHSDSGTLTSSVKHALPAGITPRKACSAWCSPLGSLGFPFPIVLCRSKKKPHLTFCTSHRAADWTLVEWHLIECLTAPTGSSRARALLLAFLAARIVARAAPARPPLPPPLLATPACGPLTTKQSRGEALASAVRHQYIHTVRGHLGRACGRWAGGARGGLARAVGGRAHPHPGGRRERGGRITQLFCEQSLNPSDYRHRTFA